MKAAGAPGGRPAPPPPRVEGWGGGWPGGAGWRSRGVPLVRRAGRAAPRLMPAGELVTVPPPVPALLTVSAKLGRPKVAVTVVAAESVTVQVPVPEQPPPLQPVKVEPAAGVAVSGTTGPPAKLAGQVAPPLIPPRALVVVAGPAPPQLTGRGEGRTAKGGRDRRG